MPDFSEMKEETQRVSEDEPPFKVSHQPRLSLAYEFRLPRLLLNWAQLGTTELN